MKKPRLSRRMALLCAASLSISTSFATRHTVSVDGKRILLNGTEVKIIGLRCSNALISEKTADQLIKNLDVFKSYGVNTVSVFLMGSRFGDVKGYLPDTSLDPACRNRLAGIIEAADRRGMIVFVGCLYWSDSKAKEDLGKWQEADAVEAVANTAAWLAEMKYSNVIIDPDNEGMSCQHNKWDISKMIAAGHARNPKAVIAYNWKDAPPSNADILVHFSPKDGKRPWVQSEGTPTNAPGGYWGKFSKERGYYNYIRIGRYTDAMKQNQIKAGDSDIAEHNGHILASTWLQAGPAEKIAGPFMIPGGLAENPDPDGNVKALHQDAGVLWWLQHVRETYGAWNPPAR